VSVHGGAQLVAAGQTEIGIYPTSEIAHVMGITIVGMLPAGIDFNTVYRGAAVADSAAPDTAAAFVKFMAAPENRGAWKDAGFDPPGK
jgi:molybdate transport system substrate-binding protein